LIPIVFVLSFPLTVGYSLGVYLCGFVLGFPLGFIPAFIGASTGAACAFIATHKLGFNFIHRRYGYRKWFKAINRVIQKHGISVTAK
jgi:uncharacterized membrane protein YdjX (TVP38/TMEM64 family)